MASASSEAGLDKDKDMSANGSASPIRQRHQGPQDRRVLLGCGIPTRGDDLAASPA